MSRVLEAELLKLRTTRTFFALAGSAVALTTLVVVLFSTLSDNLTEDDVREIFGGTDSTGLFILLLGVIGMAGEWRHRTIAATVLAVPQRLRLMAAKVLAYATAGVVLSLLVNVVVIAIATVILSSRGELTLGVADLLDVLWRNLIVAAYFGAFGVCVGTLLRNPAVAIVVILVLIFVVDNALFGLAHDVWRFGPLGGAPSGVIQISPNDESEDLLSVGAALAVMAVWLAALFAAATATLTRRDLV